METQTQIVVMSACGGLVINLLNLLEAVQLPEQQRPNFKSIVYWIPYFVNPLLGGFAGFLYSTQQGVNIPGAAGIGLAAPSFLKNIASASVRPR